MSPADRNLNECERARELERERYDLQWLFASRLRTGVGKVFLAATIEAAALVRGAIKTWCSVCHDVTDIKM